MTYVVTEPCIGNKDHACVDVCPVECIYEGEEMLFINPAECIDCGACVPECPVSAIFEEDDVPDHWSAYIAKNADAFQGEEKLAKAPTRKRWEAQRQVPNSPAARYYERYPPQD